MVSPVLLNYVWVISVCSGFIDIISFLFVYHQVFKSLARVVTLPVAILALDLNSFL